MSRTSLRTSALRLGGALLAAGGIATAARSLRTTPEPTTHPQPRGRTAGQQFEEPYGRNPRPTKNKRPRTTLGLLSLIALMLVYIWFATMNWFDGLFLLMLPESEQNHSAQQAFMVGDEPFFAAVLVHVFFGAVILAPAVAVGLVLALQDEMRDHIPWHQKVLGVVAGICFLFSGYAVLSDLAVPDDRTQDAAFAEWAHERYGVDLDTVPPSDLRNLYHSGDGFHEIFDPAGGRIITSYTNSEGTILVLTDESRDATELPRTGEGSPADAE